MVGVQACEERVYKEAMRVNEDKESETRKARGRMPDMWLC